MPVESDLGLSQGVDGLPERLGGSRGRTGGIVRARAPAGRQLSESRELILLLLGPGGLADAIRQHIHEASGELRQPLNQLREMVSVKIGDLSLPEGAYGERIVSQTRVGKQSGDFAGAGLVGPARILLHLNLPANAALQDHNHSIRGIAFPAHQFARLE